MKTKQAKITFPIRCTAEFVAACKDQSAKVYPLTSSQPGARNSAARFIKRATMEKLAQIGLNKKFLESIG